MLLYLVPYVACCCCWFGLQGTVGFEDCYLGRHPSYGQGQMAWGSGIVVTLGGEGEGRERERERERELGWEYR